MKKLFTISAILIGSLIMQQASAQMRNNKNSRSYNTNKAVVVNQQSAYQQDNHNSRGNVGQIQENNGHDKGEMHDNRDARNYTYNHHNERYSLERQDVRFRGNERYNYNHYNHYEGRKW